MTYNDSHASNASSNGSSNNMSSNTFNGTFGTNTTWDGSALPTCSIEGLDAAKADLRDRLGLTLAAKLTLTLPITLTQSLLLDRLSFVNQAPGAEYYLGAKGAVLYIPIGAKGEIESAANDFSCQA